MRWEYSITYVQIAVSYDENMFIEQAHFIALLFKPQIGKPTEKDSYTYRVRDR